MYKMGFTTKNHLFWRAMLSFKLLPIMINRRVRVHPSMHCVQTFDSFAFKMYYQTETIIVKMIKINRPINCLEFM